METEGFSAGSLGIERGQHFDTAGVDILLENIDQILKNKAELDRPKNRCLSDFLCAVKNE